MTTTIEDVFDQSIARYQAGEAPDQLIPVFQEICDRAPKSSPAWTCLAWLYLLESKPKSALAAAKKAVKLNPQDAQARVNLILAMLDTDQKGVRSHVELVQQILMAVAEVREEVEKNCADGLARKPEWKSMKRVQDWLFA